MARELVESLRDSLAVLDGAPKSNATVQQGASARLKRRAAVSRELPRVSSGDWRSVRLGKPRGGRIERAIAPDD